MKTIVFNERENERVPFLRGILTHSLLDAGLVFEEAFEMASAVRDQLAGIPEITSEELRQHVSRLLQDEGDEEVLERFRQRLLEGPRFASVDDIAQDDLDPDFLVRDLGHRGFEIRYS